MSTTLAILAEVKQERLNQDAKHGFPVLEDGTGPGRVNLFHEYSELLYSARLQNDPPVSQPTWESILREEWAEAAVEADRAKLRVELIQVAAVAVKWVEAIDRDEEGR